MRKRHFLGGLVLLGALALSASFASAQEEVAPPGKKGGVSIVFVPPPLEGTLSLGIYAKGGKLVRTLKTEANPEKDFTVGLNGLITSWDGKDDAGNVAPNGNYSVRGYAVGTLEVSGEAFHGNDWFTEENSPRVKEIASLKALDGGKLQVLAKLLDGSNATLQCDAEGKVSVVNDNDPDKPQSGTGAEELKAQLAKLPGLEKVVDACIGRGETLWVIDERSTGVEVKQYAAGSKELVRHLAIEAGEPVPRQIAAAQDEERIYLLEGAPGVQRVRGLRLENTEPASGGDGTARSTWKMFLSKQITASDSATILTAPKEGKPPLPALQRGDFKAEEKLRVKLMPNPLLREASSTVELQMAWDAKGSYLRTQDGLVLARLTDTPNLRWAVLGKEGPKATKSHVLFQSDGTVVEEYKLKQLANMMAFDAGEYEWKK